MSINPVPFGKYELISRLAAGGMAEIFLARTKSLQGFEKYLVIKKILRNRTNDPDFVRMFLDEARVAATLDHPNIIQIYDVGSFEGEYFIAMEYLRGHNLIEIVRAGAKLGYSKPPLEHVMSVLSGVCAGLHYAHEKRDFQGRSLEIVHRDVTPQNIVASFDGAVKIVDFGIAKAATREVETLAGTLKGKIGYMSPEQCRGHAVDRRSDVFAVGIILYELTTGKRLYHERSDFETLKKIIEGPVPSPRDILPFYPAALNAIVLRCLQKNPDDRYQTARDLHQDLDAFARDNQLVTGTVPLAQYMERLFADELAAQKTAESSGLAFASQMQTSSSAPSYLGEASRRSSQIAVPLDAARRQHLLTRAFQMLAAVMLVLAGGLFVWWRTKPPVAPASPMAAAPASPMAAAPAAVGQPIAAARPMAAPGQLPPGALPPGYPQGFPAGYPQGYPPPGSQPQGGVAGGVPVAGAPGLPVAGAPGVPVAGAGVAGAPGVPVAGAGVAGAPGVPVVPPPGAPQAALTPTTEAPRPKPLAKPGDAHITVASDPRCEVLVDGTPYGATPLIDLAVPAGKHTIILLNSAAGIRESQKVALATGQLWTRSFQFEGGQVKVENGLSARMLAAAAPERKEPIAAPADRKEATAPATHPKPVEGPAAAPPTPVAAPAPRPPAPTPAPVPKPAAPKPAAPAEARTVAGFVLDSQKLSQPQPHLPAFVTQRESGKKLVGTYKVCVDKAGKVYDVSTVSSISGADRDIIDTIRSWRYKPQTANVCANKVLSFQVP